MDYEYKPSTMLTNEELREELKRLDAEVKADRKARGVPPEPPEDFVPLAMAWKMYERCAPMHKFVIKYAQLCDKANEILPLTDEQIEWVLSFRKYADLITKTFDSNFHIKMWGSSLCGLISAMERRKEFESANQLLRSLFINLDFLKGEYYPPSLHQCVYLFGLSSEENERYRQEVYAEVERLEDEEYFEEEYRKLVEHYDSIKHLY